MSAEVSEIALEKEQSYFVYTPPETLLETSLQARYTLVRFMDEYLHVADGADRLTPLRRNEREYTNDYITGYTELGDLVHVRNDPYTAHAPDDYVVVIGSLEGGTLQEIGVRRVDKWHDATQGYQVRLLLDRPNAEKWPAALQPAIHLSVGSFHCLYNPGYRDARQLLIRPIEGLIESHTSVAGAHDWHEGDGGGGEKAKILTFDLKSGKI